MVSDFVFELNYSGYCGNLLADSVGEAVIMMDQRTDFVLHWGDVEDGEPTDDGHAIQQMPAWTDAEFVGNRSKIYGFLSWIVTE